MPNDIPQRQNEPEFTNLLSAYSRAYDDSAWYGSWQTGLAVGAALLIPAVNAFVPAFHPWGALIGIAILLADAFFLEKAVKKNQELGAKLQELFDTRLFGLPWNDVRARGRPDPEVIAGLTAAFMEKHAGDQKRLDRMKDWYPKAAGTVPIEYGRLICQRASMWWDEDLRRRYCTFYILLICLLVGGAFAYGLGLGLSLSQFVLAVAVPVAPAVVKIWRGYMKHEESAAASERTRQTLQSTWTQAMASTLPTEVLNAHARHIQDELLDRRKNSSRVPGWFYLLKRSKLEYQMNHGAEEMVGQALAKLGQPAPTP